MKKLLTIIFPALLIALLICVDHFIITDSSKYILLFIYLVFPLIFVIQGACASSKLDMLIGFLLSAISVIISTSIGYNMGSMSIPVIIYVLLGLLAKTLIR